MKIKLIDEWRKSYKLYTMWFAVGIMIVSILDVILQAGYHKEVPRWVFYLTGPGVAIARVIQQFFDYEPYPGYGDDLKLKSEEAPVDQ